MDFIDTLPSLAVFNENLPYPDTIAEAYWLAELACMCHERLKGNPSNKAGFWELLDNDDAKRLRRFLKDARDGVSNAANDLQELRKAEAEPIDDEETALGPNEGPPMGFMG